MHFALLRRGLLCFHHGFTDKVSVSASVSSPVESLSPLWLSDSKAHHPNGIEVHMAFKTFALP
jgi:hypothetical protein